MMPLLLIPLLLAAVLALWALLLPVALVQRYRQGRMRRRLRGWVSAINAGLLLVSIALFVPGVWLFGRWVEAALTHALLGLAGGLTLGLLGLWLTRFERTAGALHYTPNPWLVLAVTVIVAARIGLGLLRAWQWWQSEQDGLAWVAAQGSLLAVGGLLLGYYLAYTLGLWQRSRALR